MTDPIQVKVRCSGAMHTIQLDAHGRLHFLDHPHKAWDGWAVVTTLGGSGCRCYDVLEAWRSRVITTPDDLPQPLRQPWQQCRDRYEQRRARQQRPPQHSAQMRLVAWIQHAITETLVRCRYRRSHTRWAGGEHTTTVRVRAGQPDCYNDKLSVWSANGKWPGTNTVFMITVQPSWIWRVARLGLARVDNHLILDATPITPPAGADAAWCVDYVAQGQGYALNRMTGHVVQTGNFRKLIKHVASRTAEQRSAAC